MLPMTLRLADTLRHRIALFMIVALGGVAGALIAMSYRAAHDHSVAEAETAMESAAERAAAVVDQQLAPIPDLLAAAARVIHEPDGDAAFTEAALALLSAHPTLYQLYQGRPDGGFVAIVRADPRLLAEFGLPARARDGFVRIHIAATTGVQQLAWRTEDDDTWEAAPSRASRYDPRARPWYETARRNAGVQWTAPYRFAFGGSVFGMTAAVATYDEAGGLSAVVAVDVLTSVLNREVARIRIPGGGRGLLAYDDGTLLVHGSIERLRRGDVQAASQITGLAGTEDEIDLRIFQAARPNALVQVEHAGRTWIGTVRPVASTVLGRIVFLAAAPLDALVACC